MDEKRQKRRWLVTALYDNWRLDDAIVGADSQKTARLKFVNRYKSNNRCKLTDIVAKPR